MLLQKIVHPIVQQFHAKNRMGAIFFCQRITILCRQMSHDNCPFGFFLDPPWQMGWGVIIKALQQRHCMVVHYILW